MFQYREILQFMGRLGDCGALQSRAEIMAASTVAHWLGLPSHHDQQKNWDTLKSLYYVLMLSSRELPVVDVGSGINSVILKWLSKLGYQKLYACDIRPIDPGKYPQQKIRFSVQDLTQTNYPASFFQAITAISVIEHGVPIDAYVKEMSRILRPGGLLLTSTDYWSEPIDCNGIYPYGSQMGRMKVFQRHEIEGFCQVAERNGLTLCSPLNLDTTERAVRWDRVDREFTFAFIALRKTKGRYQ